MTPEEAECRDGLLIMAERMKERAGWHELADRKYAAEEFLGYAETCLLSVEILTKLIAGRTTTPGNMQGDPFSEDEVLT